MSSKLIPKMVFISNSIILKLPYNDYLTVMAHRHAVGDPCGRFTTIDINLLSKQALFRVLSEISKNK